MKKITLFVLLFMLSFALFASGAPENEEVTLHWYSHSSSLAKTQEIIVDKFMQENPNIKLEVLTRKFYAFPKGVILK